MARKARAAISVARARRARERRADARREARGSEGFERATTRIRRATPLASRGASSARAVRLAALSTAVLEQAKRVAPIANKGLNLSHNRHRLGGRRNVATRRHTSPRPHRAVDGDHGVSRDDVGERARARSPSRCASSRRSSARAQRPHRRTVGIDASDRRGGRPSVRCPRAPRARCPSPATPRDQPSRDHRRFESHRFRGRRRRVPRPDAPRPRDRRRRRPRRHPPRHRPPPSMGAQDERRARLRTRVVSRRIRHLRHRQRPRLLSPLLHLDFPVDADFAAAYALSKSYGPETRLDVRRQDGRRVPSSRRRANASHPGRGRARRVAREARHPSNLSRRRQTERRDRAEIAPADLGRPTEGRDI